MYDEIAELIEDIENVDGCTHGEDCAEYLKIIAKTQVLILKATLR